MRDRDNHLLAYPLEQGSPTSIQTVEDGEKPLQWMADGASILVSNLNEIPAKVFKIGLSDGKRELYQQIIPPDPIGFKNFNAILFSADGKMLGYSFLRSLSTLYVIDGLR